MAVKTKDGGAAKKESKAKTASAVSDDGLAWVDAGGGYSLALDGAKVLCRNAQGKRLGSVPKNVKDSDMAEQLFALRDWLAQHDRECAETVEAWMLRSLPVPRRVLEAVWQDSAWRGKLENAVVVASDDSGGGAGFFRGVDAKKGAGVVNLDGETVWLDASTLAVPHPILLEHLDDYRELSTELGLSQGIGQLFRETYRKTTEHEAQGTALKDFAEGKFEQLNHVLGKCRTLGYRVRGGFAVCPVWEKGQLVEGRFWIGAEHPEAETYTGDLLWVDARERTLKIADVGLVAFSEGMRMASAIYAARVVKEQKDE